ncbi:MAG: hypothetical protein WCL71_17550 [Deltaproteobacteria bacterium]
MFQLSIAPKSSLRPSGILFRNFRYTNEDERALVRQVFNLAASKGARVHVLSESNIPCGFVALSIKNYNKVPSVCIEYIFTSSQYRKVQYPDLGDTPLKISEYLLGYAILSALEIGKKVPLRYVFLQLGSDHLERFYSRHGFSEVDNEGWMSLDIPSD